MIAEISLSKSGDFGYMMKSGDFAYGCARSRTRQSSGWCGCAAGGPKSGDFGYMIRSGDFGYGCLG